MMDTSLEQNLVAYWPMSEGSGSTLTDTKQSIQGQLGGAATWVNDSLFGGNVLTFNGTGGIPMGTAASLSGTGSFSVCAWIKTTSSGVIIQQRNGDYNGEYQLYVDASGAVVFFVYGDESEQFNLTTTLKVNDGAWHHVLAVRDGNMGYIYIDGNATPAAQGSGTARNLKNTISVAIGADLRDNANKFSGSMAQIYIFRIAVTPAVLEGQIKIKLQGSIETNLALHKVATQSSTYTAAGTNPAASRAVDGLTSGNWSDNTVTHTNPEPQAWLQVDLGAVYQVNRVVLYNRTDAVPERLRNFFIRVSDDGITWRDFPYPGTVGASVTIQIGGTARFVKVQLSGGDPLSLAELEVYGPSQPVQADTETNLALHKVATQSSTYTAAGTNPAASRAVDGLTSGNWSDNTVTHTNPEPQAWLQVDLGAVYQVNRVVLYNRTDAVPERLRNFFIRVSDDGITWRDFPYPGTVGASVTIQIGGTARFVKVQLSGGDPLSLAELEVYGPSQPVQGGKYTFVDYLKTYQSKKVSVNIATLPESLLTYDVAKLPEYLGAPLPPDTHDTALQAIVIGGSAIAAVLSIAAAPLTGGASLALTAVIVGTNLAVNTAWVTWPTDSDATWAALHQVYSGTLNLGLQENIRSKLAAAQSSFDIRSERLRATLDACNAGTAEDYQITTAAGDLSALDMDLTVVSKLFNYAYDANLSNQYNINHPEEILALFGRYIYIHYIILLSMRLISDEYNGRAKKTEDRDEAGLVNQFLKEARKFVVHMLRKRQQFIADDHQIEFSTPDYEGGMIVRIYRVSTNEDILREGTGPNTESYYYEHLQEIRVSGAQKVFGIDKMFMMLFNAIRQCFIEVGLTATQLGVALPEMITESEVKYDVTARRDYQVTITTANIEGAGTDGTVSIMLLGEYGSSEWTVLDLGEEVDDFERNSTNTYTVNSRYIYGIKGVKLKLGGFWSGNVTWTVASVKVRDTVTGLVFEKVKQVDVAYGDVIDYK